MRIYSPNYGKFFSVDPLFSDYPFFSSYQFAANDPINAIDLDGLEPAYPKSNGTYVTAKDGNLQRPISADGAAYLNSKGTPSGKSSEATSIMVDLIPVIGTGKGWIEAATGNDLVTGETIPTWVRFASIIPYGKFLGKGKTLVKLLSKHSDEVIEQTAKHVSAVVNETKKVVEKNAGELVKKNAEQGAKFEKKVAENLKKNQENVVPQITVKTKSGTKTKLDLVGNDKANGEIKLTEAKSSATAPLTKNQKAAFPEIEKSGATVVGEGKPPFVGGTEIPPTKVDVVRP
jgi:hypothetical protein